MVSFPGMGAAGGGSGGRHGFYGGASSALRKQDFYASDLSARGGHGFYGGAASALPHNQFGNNSNTGLTPPAAEYNLTVHLPKSLKSSFLSPPTLITAQPISSCNALRTKDCWHTTIRLSEASAI